MFKIIKNVVLATRLRKSEELDLNLGSVEINETQIKYDFELLDRYQSFSSEILRLSLIGIGVYAFLLKEANGIFRSIADQSSVRYFSVASIVSFTIAVAFTLVHRYYSSDCMAYHLRYLRIKKLLKTSLEDVSRDKLDKAEAEQKAEKSDRNAILQLCEVTIAGSALFLGLGTICLAFSLLTILFK